MLKRLVCRAARWTAVAGAIVASADFGELSRTAMAAQPPVVPGYNRLKDEGKAKPAELGQVLLGELNCTQCHQEPNAKRILTKGAPDLSDAGARMTPQYLTQYLLNPHAMKPGTTMPDIFHASDPKAKEGAVEFLVHYLVSLGGPIKPARGEGNALMVEQGRRLYMSVGCVACHAPEQGTQMKVPSVPLPNLAEKTTVDALVAFLLNPLKERPASRMPNLGLSQDEAHAIAVYLLRDQLTNPLAASAPPAKPHGLEYTYYQWQTNNVALDNVGKHKPKAKGVVDKVTLKFPHRNDQFAAKLSGAITIPRDGKYTFYLNSDDGSRLYIDSKLVIDNDNEHGPAEKVGEVELLAGDHAIDVTYFQAAGEMDLKLDWAGPELNRQEVPSSVLSH
ncbi:MAG TPA: PA14 domain-containing protein, partial [Tepidisphaeraceae bacterium]|nr:PA14 domain-containing protein [Tepidisphaeraceae bacterium]